jgi:hypothetical protein
VNLAVVPDPKSPTGIALEPVENNTLILDTDLSLIDTWRAFIQLQRLGKVKRCVVGQARHGR